LRPEILFPLFAPVTSLPGVGPRSAKPIEALAGPQVVDLCWHLPSAVIDRRYAPKIAEAEPDRVATLTLRVGQHLAPRNPRQPYRIACFDDSGEISLVFFHAHADYLTKVLPEGEMRVVSGKIERFGGRLQMSHPDHIGSLDELARMKSVEPVYPFTGGLTLKPLGKAIRAALDRAPEPPEWLDPALLKREGWPTWRAALGTAHAPDGPEALSPLTPARQRLAYDELLANQLALALMRHHQRAQHGRGLRGDGRLCDKVIAALPFELTASQRQSWTEMAADMASEARMLRLLQGDVGSGKTVVALLAMLTAVEAGAQAAIMAPTEILARQHFHTLTPLAQAAGVGIELLTGRDKGKARDAALKRLGSGESALAIGTHALFQQEVGFHDLGLAVIDEQHRFGVVQRGRIRAKGRRCDVLVMTATPIPRTLSMTMYGDLDVSLIDEMPPGRTAVETRQLSRMEEGVAWKLVETEVQDGRQAFVVCPLVDDSPKIEAASATAEHARLTALMPDLEVGLIHGQLRSADKEAVMAAFRAGEIDVLVSTTVIEVGIDVPNATVMVIEDASRFGLSQLHQLRGRVGRGQHPGSCLLIADPTTPEGEARLAAMIETTDGFRLAEEDLRIRGQGTVFGTRQSGVKDLRLANILEDFDTLVAARRDAFGLVDSDPELSDHSDLALEVRAMLGDEVEWLFVS